MNDEGQYELNDCDDRQLMPSVSLLYGKHWLEMFVADYVYERQGTCKLCIYGQPEAGSRWIIGNSFMRGYYVTHDLD